MSDTKELIKAAKKKKKEKLPKDKKKPKKDKKANKKRKTLDEGSEPPKKRIKKVPAPATRRSPRIAGMSAGDVAPLDLSLNTKPEEKKPTADIHGNPRLEDFNISAATQNCLRARGVTHLYPIQAKTFDMIYNGADVLGRARTGTGKTLAFTLPIVERLPASSAYGREPRVVVLAPTRELGEERKNK
jgi:ATP-dependent RNA helicase DDX21